MGSPTQQLTRTRQKAPGGDVVVLVQGGTGLGLARMGQGQG